MNAVLAGLAVGIALLGVVMVIAYFRPAPAKPTRTRPHTPLSERWASVSTGTRWRIAIGLVLGVVLAAFTGMTLLVAVVPAAIIGLPILLSRQDTREQDLIIALETWARALAAAAETGNFTLREVVGITRGSCPELLRAPVGKLFARMSGSWSAADAFRAFADELSDPYVDEVTIYLVQASEYSRGGLAVALSSVADALADQAKLRMAVFVERQKPRRIMRYMTIIMAVSLAAVIVFSHQSQIAFYATPAGQVTLAIIIASFVMILVWAKRQMRAKPEPRIILSADTREAAR